MRGGCRRTGRAHRQPSEAQEERGAEAAREEERHRREVIAAEREGRKLASEQPYSLPGEPHRMPRASSKGTKEVLTADKKAKREANKEHSIELANAHQQLLKQKEEERIAELETMANSIALGEAIARGESARASGKLECRAVPGCRP